MQEQKPPQKKNKKNKKKLKAKKTSGITSKEGYVLPGKASFTLGDCIRKGFSTSYSSDDNGKVARCCMVSWANEWEEVNAKPTDTTQEVDQVTLRSSHQLQLLE